MPVRDPFHIGANTLPRLARCPCRPSNVCAVQLQRAWNAGAFVSCNGLLDGVQGPASFSRRESATISKHALLIWDGFALQTLITGTIASA
jgi:hypothetical protein